MHKTALERSFSAERGFRIWRYVGCLQAVLLTFFGTWSVCTAETPSREISTNSTFSDGLRGWQTSGDVRVLTGTAHQDRGSVRIGPGPGSISQRISAGAENHMMLSAVIEGVLPASCKVTLRFFDKDGHELMSINSGDDFSPGANGKLDHYFRPHPRTASVEIGVSNTGSSGSVVVEQMKLVVYEDRDFSLRGTQRQSDLMKPFWRGGSVLKEAVALFSSSGKPAMGTLMFEPSKVTSVTSYDGNTEYKPEVDYRVAGRTLIALPESSVTRIQKETLSKGELAWNEIGGKQVLVTYEHEDSWPGPVQPYVGADLPNTMQKLAAREPLEIVAYGDSITFGVGSSQVQKILPYQDPWIELFKVRLAEISGDPAIALDNASQSGADSNWAKRMAGRMVATLHPDLVIVALGQNDFWSVSADTFAANIASVIRTVRQANPKAEFLLVSTMRFDPEYSAKPVYWNAVTQYQERLRGLTGRGVQLVDMTAISGAVFAAKEPKACLNDPLHPNDYLSRWYAQSMIAALVPDLAGEGQAVPPNN